MVQTITHNLRYKMEKTLWNLDRHILVIPIHLDKGQWWTSFYSDEALQTRILTSWFRSFPIIYSIKLRKPILILIDIYTHILDKGPIVASFYSDEALQTRTLMNWCRPFHIIYFTKLNNPKES